MIETLLFSNSLHYNNGELDDSIPSEKSGKWSTKNKEKHTSPPSEFSKLGNLRVGRYPFIIPLIKGAKIVKGSIENPEVVGKLVEYHDEAAEWLCLMNMESRYSSKLWCGDRYNQFLRPILAKDIATSYNRDLFIKAIMGDGS